MSDTQSLEKTRVFLAMLLWTTVAATSSAEGWPQFRGPNASGVQSDERPLPMDIGPEKNVLWKMALATGHSSPVVSGPHVYLTALREAKLLTMALSRATGEIVWEAEAPYQQLEKHHRISSPATPSVATDGKHVVSFFGSCGMFCYDTTGKLLWHRAMGPFQNDQGAASSPILAGQSIVMVQDHDDGSFLTAIDKHSGKTLWRTDRSDFSRNYSSPVLWNVDGRRQIVVSGSGRVTGYDLESGQHLWTVRGVSRVISSTAVVGDDGALFVAATGGGESPPQPSFQDRLPELDKNNNAALEQDELPRGLVKLRFDQFDRDRSGGLDEAEYEAARRILLDSRTAAMAIEPGGEGDVTGSHVRWTFTRSIPRNASPLYYRGTLFMVKDGGILTSLDANTGQAIKQGRLRGTGSYFSSPVASDGKIYLADDRGRLSVVRADGDWQQIASADFDEPIFATPAIADGRIYLRTTGHLYCFGLKE